MMQALFRFGCVVPTFARLFPMFLRLMDLPALSPACRFHGNFHCCALDGLPHTAQDRHRDARTRDPRALPTQRDGIAMAGAFMKFGVSPKSESY